MSRLIGNFRIAYLDDNKNNPDKQASMLITELQQMNDGSARWVKAAPFLTVWKTEQDGKTNTQLWNYLQQLDATAGDLITKSVEYRYTNPESKKNPGTYYHNFTLVGIEGFEKDPKGEFGVRDRTPTAEANEEA